MQVENEKTIVMKEYVMMHQGAAVVALSVVVVVISNIAAVTNKTGIVARIRVGVIVVTETEMATDAKVEETLTEEIRETIVAKTTITMTIIRLAEYGRRRRRRLHEKVMTDAKGTVKGVVAATDANLLILKDIIQETVIMTMSTDTSMIIIVDYLGGTSVTRRLRSLLNA